MLQCEKQLGGPLSIYGLDKWKIVQNDLGLLETSEPNESAHKIFISLIVTSDYCLPFLNYCSYEL